jgi:hypothetical protein
VNLFFIKKKVFFKFPLYYYYGTNTATLSIKKKIPTNLPYQLKLLRAATAAEGVVGMLPLMRYNEEKNCRKKPSSEPKKNGGNAQENNYRRDYKNKPGLLTLLPGHLNWR